MVMYRCIGRNGGTLRTEARLDSAMVGVLARGSLVRIRERCTIGGKARVRVEGAVAGWGTAALFAAEPEAAEAEAAGGGDADVAALLAGDVAARVHAKSDYYRSSHVEGVSKPLRIVASPLPAAPSAFAGLVSSVARVFSFLFPLPSSREGASSRRARSGAGATRRSTRASPRRRPPPAYVFLSRRVER